MKKIALILCILLCVFTFCLYQKEPVKENVIVSYDDILNETTKTIDHNKPMVALTYDDGPFKTYTPMLLDILKTYNASATFFVLGDHVENNPEILERMILEGHEIGNHTYSHYQLTSIHETLVEEEIHKTQEVIYKVIQKYPAILRPPYGDYNEVVLNYLGEMKMVRWDVDSEDWRSRDVKKIVDTVLKNVKDKSIILMHDQYKTTIEASAIIIPALIEEGYQLVTVSQLYSFE